MINWWPFRHPPRLVTRRRLRYFPLPDITAYEAAMCSVVIVHTDKEFDLSAESLWSCVPYSCGRHFSMVEINYEYRGEKLVRLISSTPCFAVAKFDPLEPNSAIWEGCSRRPGNDCGSTI